MANHEIVVVAVARTPFGRFGGMLKGVSGPELAARTIDAVIGRAGCKSDAIDAAYVGVGMIGSATLTPARQAVLLSSLPETTPSLALDRACCSGMSAIGLGWKDLRLGLARAIVCGGSDNLSATPLLLPRQRDRLIGELVAGDPLLLRTPVVDAPIAAYTADEALRNGIDRGMQDEWALASHQRYFAAEESGYFEFERIPVEIVDRKGVKALVAQDESPRRDTSLEKLARLKPIYGSATITPGNAPGLNDGAAFLLLAEAGWAQREGLPILARVLDYAQVADGPTSGSFTPAIGIAQLLQRNGLAPEDLDAIEINEAYAATPLVSTLRLAEGDNRRAEILRQRTNRHGGAVAIGHPLGASGARIVMTLINGLRRRGGGVGAAAICGGFGQGDAVLLSVAP